MLDKVVIDLVYIGTSVDDKGSPHKIELKEQQVKADQIDNFSSYYYNDNERNMRLSKNFVIPKYLTNDRIDNDTNCELMYVDMNNNRFLIKNILKNKQSNLTCILDTQRIVK